MKPHEYFTPWELEQLKKAIQEASEATRAYYEQHKDHSAEVAAYEHTEIMSRYTRLIAKLGAY